MASHYRALVFKLVFVQVTDPSVYRPTKNTLYRAYIHDMIPSSSWATSMFDPAPRVLSLVLSASVNITFAHRRLMVSELLSLMERRDHRLSLAVYVKLYTAVSSSPYAVILQRLQDGARLSLLQFLTQAAEANIPEGSVASLRDDAAKLYSLMIIYAHNRKEYGRIVSLFSEIHLFGLPHPSWYIIHSLFSEFKTRPHIKPPDVACLVDSVSSILGDIPPPLSKLYLNLLVRGFAGILLKVTKHRIRLPPEIVPAMTATRKSGGADQKLELAWADVLLSLREYVGSWVDPYQGVPNAGQAQRELWSYQHVVGRLANLDWGTDRMSSSSPLIPSPPATATAFATSSTPTPSPFDQFTESVVSGTTNAHRFQLLVRASLLSDDYASALAYLSAMRALAVEFITSAPNLRAAQPRRAQRITDADEDIRQRLEGTFIRLASHAFRVRDGILLNDIFDVAARGTYHHNHNHSHNHCPGRPDVPFLMFYPRVWKRAVHAMKAWSAPWSGSEGVERLFESMLRIGFPPLPTPSPSLPFSPDLNFDLSTRSESGAIVSSPDPTVAATSTAARRSPTPVPAPAPSSPSLPSLKDLNLRTLSRVDVVYYFATAAADEAYLIFAHTQTRARGQGGSKVKSDRGGSASAFAGCEDGETVCTAAGVNVESDPNVNTITTNTDTNTNANTNADTNTDMDVGMGKEWQAPLRTLMRTLDAAGAKLPTGFWGRFFADAEHKKLSLRNASEIRRFLLEWGGTSGGTRG